MVRRSVDVSIKNPDVIPLGEISETDEDDPLNQRSKPVNVDVTTSNQNGSFRKKRKPASPDRGDRKSSPPRPSVVRKVSAMKAGIRPPSLTL